MSDAQVWVEERLCWLYQHKSWRDLTEVERLQAALWRTERRALLAEALYLERSAKLEETLDTLAKVRMWARTYGIEVKP